MTNARREYSEAETVALLSQVGGRCPLCDKPLFYKKGKRQFKAYELAHIYPLNPRPEELVVLANVPRLSTDVNDPDNLIPLCESSHAEFDKPRTEAEYLRLHNIKREALREERQRSLASQYPLENQISDVVALLHSASIESDLGVELALTAKSLDEKFDTTMPPPTKRKVRNAVGDYFRYIQAAFLELERNDPGCTELIFIQVKSFYVMQKREGLPQGHVFANLVAWIHARTQAQTLESAEAVASFFIQNCEVFE
ncbi:ABC-three component system protein [Acidovorax sp. PRC11]|uniref:ABC-three component system protein n=1 Tax=Acidovorax sp. PRC11 TaxID=2962592 RepID=UPI002882201A|nr:ABC-three component system protein [Acidovorax sp. PRC11]MDT0139091.1 HNH endonuclease [Acidovorax sp. PRC11]